MKILVVEDNMEFCSDYLLRIFSNLLPMEQLELTHTVDIESTVESLQEPWDVVLMDYVLPGPVRVPPEDPAGLLIKDGASLTRLRRQLEQAKKLKPAFIIGTSSHQVGNRCLMEAGANISYLKLQVPEMAREIGKRMRA